MNDFITSIVNAINKIPPGTWQALAASGVISPTLQAIKHWFSIESEKYMVFLMIFASGVTAAVAYILNTPNQNPTIIALHTAIIGFITTPFYYYIVKPLYLKFISEVAQAKKLNEDIKSAAVPPEGLPTATNLDDFSE